MLFIAAILLTVAFMLFLGAVSAVLLILITRGLVRYSDWKQSRILARHRREIDKALKAVIYHETL